MSKNHVAHFNFIAPLYGLFFNSQVKYYQKILARAEAAIDLSEYASIIDVGCGPGALCYVLNQKGLRVTGVDAASKMIEIAGKRLHKPDITLLQANVIDKLALADKSFDVAIASYVLHGLPQAERLATYAEMDRLARHKVIIHDYNEKRAWHTDLAEWMEGGEYLDFIKSARSEMQASFADLQVIEVDTRASWYVGTPNNLEV
jgi:ubiquinone/menaquinone biosynthesis C-methylase UbiE